MASTLAELDVLNATVSIPRIGTWTADVEVDSENDALPTRVVLDLEGYAFAGTVMRSRSWQGRVFARIVGGAGGLSTALLAKGYASTAFSLPLNDILTATGESLSGDVTSAALATPLESWTRTAGRSGHALKELMAAGGFDWRILADSTLWFGLETWPILEVPGEVLDEDPVDGGLLLAPDRANIRPGVLFQGRRVTHVTHSLNTGGLRSKVLFETDTERFPDRPRGAFEALVERLLARTDYHALWPAKVLAQSLTTGKVDLKPLDTTMPEVQAVPLRVGLPGCKPEIPNGHVVRLAFDDGDPQKPFATLFNAEDTLRLGTLVVVTNTSIGAVVTVIWFEGGIVGTVAAVAAIAALSPPLVGVPVPITAGAVGVI